MKKNLTPLNDNFYLYDLRVEVVGCKDGLSIMNQSKIGDYFEVQGEMLIFHEGMYFSMYALSAIIPLLPAKQRDLDENDWMLSDCDIVGPDPFDGTIYRISRSARRLFVRSETTKTSK